MGSSLREHRESAKAAHTKTSVFFAGNFSELVEGCDAKPLPEGYQPYLDTTFLGGLQHAVVETVNYSYYRFGPFNAAAQGTLTLEPVGFI